jgi:hypothetical protein
MAAVAWTMEPASLLQRLADEDAAHGQEQSTDW